MERPKSVRGATYGKLEQVSDCAQGKKSVLLLTRYDVPRVGLVFVLDEAKSTHKLDLANCSRTLLEVVLDVLLGDCRIGDKGQQ